MGDSSTNSLVRTYFLEGFSPQIQRGTGPLEKSTEGVLVSIGCCGLLGELDSRISGMVEVPPWPKVALGIATKASKRERTRDKKGFMMTP